MLPRGLTSQIVLAFAGLSAAMLVAVSVTLFLVLHQLHQNEIEDTLSRQLVQVVVNLSREPVAQWDSTLQDAGGPIADDGGYILVQNPNGAIRVLAVDDPDRPDPRTDEDLGRQGLHLRQGE